MATGMDNIEHVVVAMFENRSFDNLLGWLYSHQGNIPPHILPASSSPPYYQGLIKDTYSNSIPGATVYASQPTKASYPGNNPYLVPDPDPGELFKQMNEQIFGTSNPGPNDKANMSGFLRNYTSIPSKKDAAQIMQSYSTDQVSVISQLAKTFAVSDEWHASAPCQTWPNRGFVHTGSSDGHINNDDYELYDIRTIFNVMEEQKLSWGVYSDVSVAEESLTYIQFLPKLWFHAPHFHLFKTFETHCSASESAPADDKLPTYSFVEPRFLAHLEGGMPNDYHPPHNVCRGEQYLSQVYQAIRNSPYRDKIMLVITFDEHGGCYDHLPPLNKAVAPIPGSVSRHDDFHFDRFGVRIPTIVVSSYVEPGTVFRSNKPAPYDHTSILATLRDWKCMDKDPKAPFLPSPRIKQAPTLDQVLTLDTNNKNTIWPDITATCTVGTDDESLDTPLNDVQMSLVVGEANKRAGNKYIGSKAVQELRDRIKTYQDAIDFMGCDE